jgi:hypothetical protein
LPNLSKMSRRDLEELLVTLFQQLRQSCKSEKAQDIMRRAVRELPRSKDFEGKLRVIHILKFQLWKRKFHPQEWVYLEGRLSDAKGLGRLTAKIIRAIDAIDSSFGWKKIAIPADEVPPAAMYSVWLATLIEIAINIVAAGIYDLAVYGVKRIRRRPSRTYSESELIEQAQRALANRLSLDFDRLVIRSIEASEPRQAIADFQVKDGDSYQVSIEMINGIAVITRMRHDMHESSLMRSTRPAGSGSPARK